MRTRPVRAAAVVLVAAMVVITGLALADADPASDVLLGANVFYPYDPAPSSSLQATLNAETAAAAKAHFPIKVALIKTSLDLGAIPQLFGKPREYAAFLDREISFNGPVPVLVVMPNGYGAAGLTGAAAATAASLAGPVVPGSNGLAQAAVSAVRKLAAAAGHPLPRITVRSATSRTGSGIVLPLVMLPLVCGAMASLILSVRRRRARVLASRRRARLAAARRRPR